MNTISAKIGPTFGSELVKLGIADGVFYTPDSVSYGDEYKQSAKLRQAIANHDPSKELVTNVSQVTDTQFIQALAEQGIIEWSDAQAWGSKGDLPKLLVTALDKIEDPTTRNRAYMKAMSAKTYIYSDPWLQMLATKLDGWNSAKLQQLFNFAATL